MIGFLNAVALVIGYTVIVSAICLGGRIAYLTRKHRASEASDEHEDHAV